MKCWTVLLIGGASGTGKSTVARAIARQHDADWLQVDDLRLALQWSGARLPRRVDTEALSFFLNEPEVWQLPVERLCDAQIATGRAMMEAIAIVAGNHLAQRDPVVIEGDSILPELLEHPELRSHVASGQLRSVFLSPGGEDELLRNMIDRDRGMPEHRDQLRRIAGMNWRYAQWLTRQARARSLPVIATQPHDSLGERIVAAV